VALHFYHPLAHWLAGRLRLEQELAADAWTARLAGGNQNYLTTLARMALRRDERKLSWPARAFLPSRGTFVRRLEMLRNSQHVRHAWLSATTRYLTIGGLALLGVLIAGQRGPINSGRAQAQDAPAREVPGGGGGVTEKAEFDLSFLPAETRILVAAREVPGGGGGVAEKSEFDLSFLPAETRILVAARPAAVLSRPEMNPIVEMMKKSHLSEAIPLPPEEIDQAVLFWEGDPANPERPGLGPMIPAPSGLIVKAAKPQAWKKIIARQDLQFHEVQHSGQVYYRPAERPAGFHGPMSIYFADERTAICARDDLLRLMIEDRKAPKPKQGWDEAWSRVARGQFCAALETRWLRRRLNQAFAGAQHPQELKLETIGPLLEKARAYALSVDVDKQLTVEVVAIANSAEEVKPVADTAQALLTLGRNAASSMHDRTQEMGQFRETGEWVIGFSPRFWRRLTWSRTDRRFSSTPVLHSTWRGRRS
jgi:hypothetical protein